MRLLKQPLNLIYLDTNKLKAELQDIVLIMQICHCNFFCALNQFDSLKQ